MKRRDFLRVTLVGGAAAAVAPLDLWGKGTGKSGFTLWQLPSQVDTIGNSFVFLTDKGRVVVMDGGRIVFDVKGEERSKMTVDDLLEKFRENAGKALDNDRILLSKVEAGN